MFAASGTGAGSLLASRGGQARTLFMPRSRRRAASRSPASLNGKHGKRGRYDAGSSSSSSSSSDREQLCAFDHSIESRIETIALDKEGASCLPEIFKKALRYRRNWFVDSVLSVRQAFCNFGLSIKAVQKADREKLKEFLESSAGVARLEQVSDYVDELWQEWLTCTNGISFWRNTSARPIVLDLSEVKYSDKFGTELLTIRHQLTTDQIRRLNGWTKAEKDRLLASQEVKIPADDPHFHFKVAKRAKLGAGLGWPRMYGVFETLNFIESLEVGDAIRAFVTRTVWEQHKMGHEIKQGNLSGSDKFHWKKGRSDAFINWVKGKSGHVRVTTNFDHEVTFPGQDPKLFDAKRFDSAVTRLLWWSQPIGQMVQARGVTPYLMDLLGRQCEFEREKIGRCLRGVLNEAFEWPVEVRVQWSSRCFRDTRLAIELLKFGLQNGPFSQTSYIEEAGGDPEVERARKEEESQLPKAQTLPLFDAAHGGEPGKLPGRKPGTPDP